ncbi:hypothetical protein [Pyrococcus sp. NA2]|uniref:hypothetical protein n=1 Tax=Pyrococcus sp. (strain NA2) TaxID=342949 RepID=UPI000AAE5D3B|nr:hypothetical protein [Pyrococcus sp. NA2]
MRLLRALALFFFLLPGIMMANYIRYSDDILSTQPYPLVSEEAESELHFIDIFVPTSSLAEIECVGGGKIIIIDESKREVVFYETFSNKLASQLMFPHEGEYILYSENTKRGTSCIIRVVRNRPTVAVQRGIYLVGIISGVLLLLWRWRK